MSKRNLLLLPGDGIGPETMAEVRKIIDWMNADLDAGFAIEEGLVGGSAYDAHGQSISEGDMEKALAAEVEPPLLLGNVKLYLVLHVRNNPDTRESDHQGCGNQGIISNTGEDENWIGHENDDHDHDEAEESPDQ